MAANIFWPAWYLKASCIANDRRHFENFFDVSFYPFTHNYSLFTLLFKHLLFSELVAGTILSSLDKFDHKFMMKLKKLKR
jgi:hypothetical protein